MTPAAIVGNCVLKAVVPSSSFSSACGVQAVVSSVVIVTIFASTICSIVL